MANNASSLHPGRDYPRDWTEFIDRFPDESACLSFLENLRWPHGFVCPHCSHAAHADAFSGNGRVRARNGAAAVAAITSDHQRAPWAALSNLAGSALPSVDLCETVSADWARDARFLLRAFLIDLQNDFEKGKVAVSRQNTLKQLITRYLGQADRIAPRTSAAYLALLWIGTKLHRREIAVSTAQDYLNQIVIRGVLGYEGRGYDMHSLRHGFGTWLMLRAYSLKHPELKGQLLEQQHAVFSQEGQQRLTQLFQWSEDEPLIKGRIAMFIHIRKVMGHSHIGVLIQNYLHAFGAIHQFLMRRM